MPNMSLKKNEMPSQDPNVRNKNFLEVALGYREHYSCAVDLLERVLSDEVLSNVARNEHHRG